MFMPLFRHVASLVFLGALCLLPSKIASAGIDDCLKAALNTANPSDLKKAAAFATNHPSCLVNLAPPTLVPYIALSGSLDVANQSGALNKAGLGFNSYQQCADKVNPGNATVKQLAPVLKPVCSTLNMDCNVLEGPAADEVNSQLASQVPLLSLLPCSCAAATSGLGVEKIAELVKDTKQCGATIAQVGEALGDAAVGVYDVAGDAVGYAGDATNEAIKLGESIVNSIGSAGCALYSLVGGGCGDSPPPSAISVGTAICKPRQGLWMLGSASSQPNDFSLKCNDGLQCVAKPGKPTQCAQGMTKTQSEKAEADKVLADAAMREANPKICLQRGGELKKGYDLRCRDGQCKTATFFVAAEYADICTKGSNFHPQAAALWTIDGEKPFLDKFEKMITESIQRDPKTPPLELLRTYDCRSFLGRADESLCNTSMGFNVCKKLVDAAKMTVCRMKDGTVYRVLTINPAVLGALGKASINTTPVTTVPISEPTIATEAAPTVINNASLLRTAQIASETATPAIEVSDTFLANAAKKGCRPFLGHRDQLMCDNQAGFDECVQAVNRNMLHECRNAVNGEIKTADQDKH
ncbi:MAG TPA: hypothetical protein VN247_01655 [Arenimonas sp.]|nr:hypothetical protein [Arenimonas sp.]